MTVMQNADGHIALNELSNGDIVRVLFEPAYVEEDYGDIWSTSGEVMTIVGQIYVASSEHKSSMGMPKTLRIDDHPRVKVVLLEAKDAKLQRLAARARGEVIFPSRPESSAELLGQLSTLAEMIAVAPTKGLHSRRDELRRQFDDVADIVELAQRKRTYILTRAVVGGDFHPWITRDDRIFRIETERPLPADFEFDRKIRKDRIRRLDQSIRIFGEAERETRKLASLLRSAGYDVRRPHPNAQELLVRITWGSRVSADMELRPSENGLWSVHAKEPSNKKQSRAKLRLVREKHVESLRMFLGL